MNSILLVQNGDYRAAYQRFAAGDPETYRDQKRSVDFVANLAPDARVTTAAFGPETYQAELAPNLFSEGMVRNSLDPADIARIFDAAAPTHVVVRSPHVGFLQEAARRQVHTLPVFADLFTRGDIRARWHNRKLRRVIERCKAPCVANHSLNASRSLAAIGFAKDRIVPWDWSRVPIGGPAKPGVTDAQNPSAIYAGGMSEVKGIGDCLEAAAHLKTNGRTMTLTVAGGGDDAPWRSLASKLGIDEQIHFIGRVPNADIREKMRAHDFVIVPSRHSYPEGLPNTIYEGLAARSALILSDHPAFSGRLQSDQDALVFKASDPADLAKCIVRATDDPALYSRLSDNAERAHEALYVGLEWTKLVETFLEDPENRKDWVAQNALSALS